MSELINCWHGSSALDPVHRSDSCEITAGTYASSYKAKQSNERLSNNGLSFVTKVLSLKLAFVVT